MASGLATPPKVDVGCGPSAEGWAGLATPGAGGVTPVGSLSARRGSWLVTVQTLVRLKGEVPPKVTQVTGWGVNRSSHKMCVLVTMVTMQGIETTTQYRLLFNCCPCV